MSNKWTRFLSQHGGQGLSMSDMSLMYRQHGGGFEVDDDMADAILEQLYGHELNDATTHIYEGILYYDFNNKGALTERIYDLQKEELPMSENLVQLTKQQIRAAVNRAIQNYD